MTLLQRGRPVVCTVVITLVLVFARTASAQGQRGDGAVPPEIRAATDFLMLAYPDLATRPVSILFNRDGLTVALSVTDVETPGTPNESERVPLLTAAFEFLPSGALRTFAAQGVLVNASRNAALIESLSANADWTDTDAESALLTLGGRASAALSTATTIDPEKLAPFVGESPHVSNSELRWRPTKEPGGSQPFAASPGWVSQLTAIAKDGTASAYCLTFEPFGGRLVLVTLE